MAEAPPMPPWNDEAPDTSTVALLYQQFGDVLIDLEAVRKAYFRNRSSDRFRRGLREGAIPLPVVTLDTSAKGQGYVCIYHLAALIEARALGALAERQDDIAARMRRAVPSTECRDVVTTTHR